MDGGHALTARRALIASLAAQGWSRPRIARALEISVSTVRDNLALPAVRAEIARESIRLRDAVRFELAEAMAEEERASFDRWRELRDQDDRPGVALAAVRMHFDRMVPRLGPRPAPPPPRRIDHAALDALCRAVAPMAIEMEERQEAENAERPRAPAAAPTPVEPAPDRAGVADLGADAPWSEAGEGEAAAARVPPAAPRAHSEAAAERAYDEALCALREADRRRARPDGTDDAADAPLWRDRWR